MTRGRADNEGNVPTDDLHGLYYERASAGLIITEGASVS
jgi:N-ethylmaleimide reductase